jgi:hypothetical protein
MYPAKTLLKTILLLNGRGIAVTSIKGNYADFNCRHQCTG